MVNKCNTSDFQSPMPGLPGKQYDNTCPLSFNKSVYLSMYLYTCMYVSIHPNFVNLVSHTPDLQFSNTAKLGVREVVGLLSTAVTIQNFWILIFRYSTAGAPSGQASRNTATTTRPGTEQGDSIWEDSGYPSRAQDGNGAWDQSERHHWHREGG